MSSSLSITILSLINTRSHTHTATTRVSWVWHQHAHWHLFCRNDSQLSDAVVFAPPEFGMAAVQLLQLSPCCVLHMSCWSVRKPQISSPCRCLSLHWSKKVDYLFTTGQILSHFEKNFGPVYKPTTDVSESSLKDANLPSAWKSLQISQLISQPLRQQHLAAARLPSSQHFLSWNSGSENEISSSGSIWRKSNLCTLLKRALAFNLEQISLPFLLQNLHLTCSSLPSVLELLFFAENINQMPEKPEGSGTSRTKY